MRETTPPRRIVSGIERVRDDATGEAGGAGQTRRHNVVTFEKVTRTLGGGRFACAGEILTTTGSGEGLLAGDTAPVAWVDGRPVVILYHHSQRAQFHPVNLPAGAVIEEIFVGTDDEGRQDVFFRNFGQITALETWRFLDADPLSAFWGVNADVFAVLTGADTYWVFRLKRNPKKILYEKAAIKALLYKVTLSDVVVPVTVMTVNLHRDSVAPVIKSDWHPTGSSGAPFAFDDAFVERITNVDKADVTRTVTLTLKGASEVDATCAEVDASLVLVNDVSAGLVAAIVDENDDLVYTAALTFNDFGVQQGNSSVGLTGEAKLIGPGTPTPVGGFDADACPWIVDDVAFHDFMDHGNVGGILHAAIPDTHSVTVRVRGMESVTAGTVVFTTVAASKTMLLEESTDGLDPYPVDHLGDMPVLADQCAVPDTFSFNAGNPETDIDFGDLGNLGVISRDNDLFAAGLAFAPDTPDRQALVLTNDPRQWFDIEPVGVFNTYGSSFAAANHALKATWSTDLADVKNRYKVEVTCTPFWSQGGAAYQFVSVLRTPIAVLDAHDVEQFPDDKHQVGAFVIIGGISVTALAYNDTDAADVPRFMTGNSRRVLWQLGDDWFMTDFADAVPTKKIGSDVNDVVDALVLVNQDLLYASLESERFFVKGWAGRTITLDQAAAGFPPKDAALANAGKLKDLPPVSQEPRSDDEPYPLGSFHVVEDAGAGVKFK